MADRLDFVAVGDIVNDEFITLRKSEAQVTDDPTTGRSTLSMAFGDKLPYEGADIVNAVGNSPNAAVSAHRLGLKSAIVTDIGDDDEGKLTTAALAAEQIDTRFVRTHAGKATNHHYVLRYGAERTILIKHEEYEYRLPEDLGEPSWLYFSSVGENSLAYHHEIAAYVKAHPQTKLVFQPGSFQIKLGTQTLKDIYEVTELFFCNVEEAMRIVQTDSRDIKTLMEGIRSFGVKLPVITDGPKGAYAYDNGSVWMMPIYPDPAPPVDRTGAGDSFASTFTAMLALGNSVPEALKRAPINSMSVVQYIGAQKGLLTLAQLDEWLAKAPADYQPVQVA
jgi:ribokinase